MLIRFIRLKIFLTNYEDMDYSAKAIQASISAKGLLQASPKKFLPNPNDGFRRKPASITLRSPAVLTAGLV